MARGGQHPYAHVRGDALSVPVRDGGHPRLTSVMTPTPIAGWASGVTAVSAKRDDRPAASPTGEVHQVWNAFAVIGHDERSKRKLERLISLADPFDER
jgi:hypothetical protein